jgi:heme-degrading monooxygenase HmoA
MAHFFARVSLEDYAKFRETFDSKEDMRKAAGATNSTVYQSVDNPNEVVVQIEFPSADAAKAFSTSEGLRNAVQQAGAKEPPRIVVVNET